MHVRNERSLIFFRSYYISCWTPAPEPDQANLPELIWQYPDYRTPAPAKTSQTLAPAPEQEYAHIIMHMHTVRSAELFYI